MPVLRLLFFSISIFISATPVFAQLNAPITPGARGLAMGGTGLNTQDIHAAWANPAGLSGLDSLGFVFYGEQRFSLSELKQVSAVAAMPVGKAGGIGLILGYYGFDAYNEQRIGIAYGRKLSKNISIGAQLFSWNTKITEYGNKNLLSFELGGQARINHEVSLGVKVINPVRISVLEDEYLPTLMSFGLQYQPGDNILIQAEAEKDVLLPLRIRIGIEYALIDALDVRIGVATNETQLSFGFGYQLKKHWQLDFAAAYHQYLGFTPGIGLVYR